MIDSQPLYLDYAAATPVDPEVLALMQPYFTENFYNPSSLYSSSINVKKDLNLARADVASVIGAKPQEIVFTAGASEANNLAIRGVMDSYPNTNIVVSSIEHDSVIEPAGLYERRIVKVKKDGRLDLDDLANKIDQNTVLVSIMHANNEIGTIQPLHKIAELIAKKRSLRTNKLPIYLHSDAAQSANYLDIHVSRLGVDLLSLNGGKIYGPKQSGALFVSSKIQLKPLVLGGGQEKNRRSGTENIAGSIGFSKALILTQSHKQEEGLRLKKLQEQAFKLLQDLPIALEINGSLKHRLPNNVHVTFKGIDNERLIYELDERGILASAGSACSASSDEPSHVLRAIGLNDTDANQSIRFTLGKYTDEADILKLVDSLKEILAKYN